MKWHDELLVNFYYVNGGQKVVHIHSVTNTHNDLLSMIKQWWYVFI